MKWKKVSDKKIEQDTVKTKQNEMYLEIFQNKAFKMPK